MAVPLLSVRNLSKHYDDRGSRLTILHDVSFEIGKGEVVGLVGESGSGKTTIGRSVLRLVEPSSGSVRYDGVELTTLSAKEMQKARPRMQYVFQDPFASLSPRMTVGQILTEGLGIQGIGNAAERVARARQSLELVDLPGDAMNRYAYEFSGGQRQRIGIARAITLKPRIIVADEATSALDVSVRFHVLDLLMRIQDELGLAYIFISHDIGVIRYMCDRVGVMYRGKLVEVGDAEKICNAPDHPYTQALLSAIPRPDPRDRDRSRRFRYTEPAADIAPALVATKNGSVQR